MSIANCSLGIGTVSKQTSNLRYARVGDVLNSLDLNPVIATLGQDMYVSWEPRPGLKKQEVYN